VSLKLQLNAQEKIKSLVGSGHFGKAQLVWSEAHVSEEPININIFPPFGFPPSKTKSTMENADTNSEGENDAEMKLLRDKFRLSAIAITESQGSMLLLLLLLCISTFYSFEIRVPNYRARQFNYAAKQNGMTVSKVVVTCIADLAFKYTGNKYHCRFIAHSLSAGTLLE